MQHVGQRGIGAVLLIDINRFSVTANVDSWAVGDQLLINVAQRLSTFARSVDIDFRVGGDEFVYLAEQLTSLEQAKEIATELLAALRAPYEVMTIGVEAEYVLSWNVGVAIWSAELSHAEDWFFNADIALVEAKERGENQVVVFTTGMR